MFVTNKRGGSGLYGRVVDRNVLPHGNRVGVGSYHVVAKLGDLVGVDVDDVLRWLDRERLWGDTVIASGQISQSIWMTIESCCVLKVWMSWRSFRFAVRRAGLGVIGERFCYGIFVTPIHNNIRMFPHINWAREWIDLQTPSGTSLRYLIHSTLSSDWRIPTTPTPL